MGAKAVAVAKWMRTVMFEFKCLLPRGLPLAFVLVVELTGKSAFFKHFSDTPLSWGGPNWEFWAHTPIIKLTYLFHFAIFALGRSKL